MTNSRFIKLNKKVTQLRDTESRVLDKPVDNKKQLDIKGNKLRHIYDRFSDLADAYGDRDDGNYPVAWAEVCYLDQVLKSNTLIANVRDRMQAYEIPTKAPKFLATNQ